MSNELGLFNGTSRYGAVAEDTYLEVAADGYGGGGSPYNGVRFMWGRLKADGTPDWGSGCDKFWLHRNDIDRLIDTLLKSRAWLSPAMEQWEEGAE